MLEGQVVGAPLGLDLGGLGPPLGVLGEVARALGEVALADLGEAQGGDADEGADGRQAEHGAVAADESAHPFPRGVAVGADDLAGLEPPRVVGELLGAGVAAPSVARHRLVVATSSSGASGSLPRGTGDSKAVL